MGDQQRFMTASSKSCGKSKGRAVKDHLLKTRTGNGEPWSILLFYQHLVGGWDGVQCNDSTQNILEGEDTRAGNPSCTSGECGCCGLVSAELSSCCSPQSWVRWVWFCQPRGMQLLLEIKTGRGWLGPMDHHHLWGRTVPGSIFPSIIRFSFKWPSHCDVLCFHQEVWFVRSISAIRDSTQQTTWKTAVQRASHWQLMWLLSYSTRKVTGKKKECLSVSFPGEISFCHEKARVFMWCCSLMTKQSLQGSVLQLGWVAEHPGAQPLLCLPALASWEDPPCRRS